VYRKYWVFLEILSTKLTALPRKGSLKREEMFDDDAGDVQKACLEVKLTLWFDRKTKFVFVVAECLVENAQSIFNKSIFLLKTIFLRKSTPPHFQDDNNWHNYTLQCLLAPSYAISHRYK
jgi:hypothetical protein